MSWVGELQTRVLELKARHAQLDSDSSVPRDKLQYFHTLIDAADAELNATGRILGWMGSSRPTKAWGLVHDAEEACNELVEDSRELLFQAKLHGEQSLNGKYEKEKKLLEDQPLSDESLRFWSRSIIHEAHEEDAKKHETERNQAKGVVTASMFILGALVAILVVQFFYSTVSFLPEIPVTPNAGANVGGLPLMVLVMLFGLVGGLLSGIVGLYLSSAVPTDTRWYDPRPPLMIAKAVLGMLTALIGVMLIASKVVVGAYESLPSVLLLALAFGFSQLVVTQFLDKRIKDILPAGE